jgi:hypothetical protein
MLSPAAFTASIGAELLPPLCLGDEQERAAIVAITAHKNIDLIDSDFVAVKSKNVPYIYYKRLDFA